MTVYKTAFSYCTVKLHAIHHTLTRFGASVRRTRHAANVDHYAASETVP